MVRIKTYFKARIFSPDGDIRATVNFDNKLEALNYTHDALRFERFGRGCYTSIDKSQNFFELGQ